jgi:hypothetical protein
MNRREFLNVVAASALIVAHDGLGKALSLSPPDGQQVKGSPPRIVGLELRSACDLTAMKEFYHGSLGLPVINENQERLTIAAGETRLTFLSADPGSKPFYHFAFNIPENKIVSAHRWQSERTQLIPIPPSLRDPAYPDEVVDYRHWNAHSVFFFDPSGNVVEYIARHDLRNAASSDRFSSGDILYASEIGLVVDDVPATVTRLKTTFAVEQYRGGSEQFTALGDEKGLLLVMKRGRIISFASPEKKSVTVFPTTASIRAPAGTHYVFPDFPYRISAEG